MKTTLLAALCDALTLVLALAADQKPNILLVWGGDIGAWNMSHNNRCMMGYRTPNIDRIAGEGVAIRVGDWKAAYLENLPNTVHCTQAKTMV